jgi:predicted MFS family arabinose efflux permease
MAAGLALAAAVSLGMARFSYALLLPAMRADLGWTYFTAGAMNTFNAAGYLLGALLAPRALARFDARQLLLAGGFLAAALLAAHGAVRSDALLYALRLGTGVASALSFIAGGLLAARLAGMQGHAVGDPRVPPSLVLGLYYGGTGLGIVLSAGLVRPNSAAEPLVWPEAWMLLGLASAAATVLTAASTRDLHSPPGRKAAPVAVPWTPLAFALAGYGLFGLGYIGYMTFIITVLREQGLGPRTLTAFYSLLGLAVVASSWLWAALLQRFRGGQALAVLNLLLAVATGLTVVSSHPVVVFVSGALFGAVFLSVVAATTALVRHNLPAAQWPGGIAAFTIVFAAGQIVGPALVGAIADGPGGLLRGLAWSAAALALGAALALCQRPLPR